MQTNIRKIIFTSKKIEAKYAVYAYTLVISHLLSLFH